MNGACNGKQTYVNMIAIVILSSQQITIMCMYSIYDAFFVI